MNLPQIQRELGVSSDICTVSWTCFLTGVGTFCPRFFSLLARCLCFCYTAAMKNTATQKTGLVMEGGAMRGVFTAGVTDVLIEAGITFDGAIGVSAGASFGCNVKSRQAGRVIRYTKRFSRNWRFCSLRSLLFTGDIFGAKFCYDTIPNELDPFDFDAYRANPLRFYAVASDCRTGDAVFKELSYCDKADLLFMQAGASMPLASRVVHSGGRALLDGGMTTSIPLKAFENMGFTRNVVILTQPRDFVKQPASLLPLMRLALWRYPKLFEAMKKRHLVYNEEKSYAFMREKEGAALVITPEKPLSISRTEKNPDALQRVYDEGRRIAEARLSEIQAFLGR